MSIPDVGLIVGQLCNNLKSITNNTKVTKRKLAKELEVGCVAGPFEKPPLKDFMVSSLAGFPKKEPDQYRLI